MRKTIIALMLVIPMCFVLVIFSSVNLVSLNVNVSVSGISITIDDGDVQSDMLLIDMAEGKKHKVTAEVFPDNATEKGYTLSSNNTDILDVAEDGSINPKKTGSAIITATSKDKNFTDSITVNVTSSKAYDFSFSIYNADGEDVLVRTDDGYSAQIESGLFAYGMKIEPGIFGEYSIEADNSTVVDKGGRELLFPFSGKTTVTVTVPDGASGKPIIKTATLDIKKPSSNTGISINGVADSNVILLSKGTSEATLYIESDYLPTFESEFAEGEVEKISGNKYILTLRIDPDFDGEEMVGEIKTTLGKAATLTLSFRDYDFAIRGDNAISVDEDGYYTSVTVGNETQFYAVSVVASSDVTYIWQADNDKVKLSSNNNGDACTVVVSENGDFVLTVSAKRGDKLLAQRRLRIFAMPLIGAVIISNNVKVDLAERYTMGGKRYDGDRLVDSDYPLKVFSLSMSGVLSSDINFINYYVSDENVATIENRDGALYLIPLADGKITVSFEWKGNEAFGTEIGATLNINVVKDAVEVSNAPELVRATEAGYKVVLKEDIMLGTDANGKVMSIDTRASMFKRAKSTYNIEWYKRASDASEDDAYISYVMEFKNDVYGNGHKINADYFTHEVDGSDVAVFDKYRGPLYFVKYKNMASVAGQDNCAFLIRTNGVKLYGVNLMGCSDSRLKGEGDSYDLRQLNLVGTTLDINANADIINCRISNGRNVVRIYGGNKDGNHYFIEDLAENTGCEDERINVTIEGCIISQSREFLVKIGANRALRASNKLGAQPNLVDENGSPYKAQGSERSNYYPDLYLDDYFYENYVLTDVTIKDSVLETSGLFTVGVESNFGGEFLFEGASDHNWRAFTSEWEDSGGTSFASVLRLEGDVRLYDWKDINLIDSSSLIESPIGQLSAWLKLDIKNMLDFVHDIMPDVYGNLIEEDEGKEFVHGGIAFYGGGTNYSQFDMRNLNEDLKDFEHYNINIDILYKSSDANMNRQGELLPSAAGKNDFNFYMYGNDSSNNYLAQKNANNKYKGVTSVPLFD